MTKITNIKDSPLRIELDELKKRVDILEEALQSKSEEAFRAFMGEMNFVNTEPKQNDEDKILSHANQSSVYFGSSITPVDLSDVRVMDALTKEFNIIQCDKASIPTQDHVDTRYGPMIDFSFADDVMMFCARNGLSLKDGPYINCIDPIYKSDISFEALMNWVSARVTRPGFVSPEYITLAANFIDDNGFTLTPKPLKMIGLKSAIMEMSDIVDGIGSGLGISVDIDDFAVNKHSKKLLSFCKYIVSLMEFGCPLQYAEIRCTIQSNSLTGSDASRKVIRDNIKLIEATGIPELHFDKFSIKPDGENQGVSIYEDFLDVIASDNLTTYFSLASHTRCREEYQVHSKRFPTEAL